MRLSSVVFPAPRNPVRMVTGTMLFSCMGRSGSEKRILALEDQQALEVFALGKFERHRVIGGGAEALDDLCPAAGVERRTGDDGLEKLRRHAARAGEGREEAAGGQQL